ncbi:imidazole glycerol phosphate synthase subunit HisH [Paremcibacter congregatus]|uniref:imidazole glycerol phosphate synthase subunit HisH n=1 Tax=Paremcibacter congregatus TaxID=2043170 RepID=UPI003A930B97
MVITIVDYGLGNLGSIANIVRKCGGTPQITSNVEYIKNAEKIILPGVGAFDNGMSRINELGFADILRKKAIVDKVPILGICLGMQLLTRSSNEGKINGLGLIDAIVKKFEFDKSDEEKKKVPHMGWNFVQVVSDCSLLRKTDYPIEDPRFYFVHSYYVKCNDQADVVGVTRYGHDFVSVFHKNNIYGMQFHPEKSHKFGMSVFRDFINLKG